jgi:transposase
MHSKQEGRRRYSAELKAQILAACREPGASIASVAMAYSVNANLLHKWRQREISCTAPVASVARAEFIALPMPAAPEQPVTRDIHIELRRGTAVVTLTWPVSSADACAAWLGGWLR